MSESPAKDHEDDEWSGILPPPPPFESRLRDGTLQLKLDLISVAPEGRA